MCQAVRRMLTGCSSLVAAGPVSEAAVQVVSLAPWREQAGPRLHQAHTPYQRAPTPSLLVLAAREATPLMPE